MKLLVLCQTVLQAQHVQWFRRCPVPTDFELDVEAYTGRWYDTSRISVMYQDDDATCPMVMYTYIDEQTVGVNNTQIVQDGPNGPTSEFIIGKAVMTNPKKSNKLTVTFDFDQPFLSWIIELFLRWMGSNYWVMDTDYDNYSLVVCCENFWIMTRVSAWVLARDPKLPENNPRLMQRLYRQLDSYNVPTEVMFESNHDNCNYEGQQYYEETNDIWMNF